MRTVLLAVISLAVASACASRPVPEPLRYTIDNNVLRFEREGVMYAVTDPARVERARIAATNLYRPQRELAVAEPSRVFPRETWDVAYVSTNGIGGVPPAQTAEQAAQNSSERAIRNDSMRFADEAAETQTQLRRLEDDYARATKKLKKIFDDAVTSGRAARV